MKRKTKSRIISFMLVAVFMFSIIQLPAISYATVTVEQTEDGYHLSNEVFDVEIGEYGQITSLKIVGDLYSTNYVMNKTNSPGQDTSGHEWIGELMFKTKVGDSSDWVESLTQSSDSVRKIELVDNKVVVTYENAAEERGIKDFKLVESYSLVDDKLRWEIKIINTNSENLTIGDLGLPLAFNERWPSGEEIYESRTVDHSFVGKNSSYVYATRPSGLGQFLLLTPDVSTGAGFEYQDHWRTQERSTEEAAWCQDQSGWANGLNVFYIHSDVIKSTNRGYLENTFLELAAGEEKTYAFNFTVAQDEKDMKTTLYEEGLIDAVAVPGMTFAKNMPAKMYLHTKVDNENISFEVQCPHENGLHAGNPNTVSNNLPHVEDNFSITYLETKAIDGEQYHIYDISFSELGQNNVIISYDTDKETVLQFYIMDSVEDALEVHSNFMVEKTQWDDPGTVMDKVFDDWMMDTKEKRGVFDGYWGWGDDWGLTHGQYIAEKNVYQPVAAQIQAIDDYLNVAIWNGLMREHQEDYKIHDFLMPEPNDTPLYRGYAYPHIYNTFFSMYKIASRYPDMIDYEETADTYLMRAYNIMNALYGEGVAYNWETGLMGELTTPDIIDALDKEGYYEEAQNIRDIMAKKYDNFKEAKYPYGSEYSYDNTGEEAVYTLAKVNNDVDTANSNQMMSKIDAKTRACRGLQPVWYHYANPTTICGENWWNFQYTASLAGYAMDDWLRIQDNGMTESESAAAERVNYAAKLANLTAINSGQIDADQDNIGTVSWTYQSEMGNLGGQGTGEGNLHNGWRQMAGEADLGLFGAVKILSSDVAVDPVFGLFGYGCKVAETTDTYKVTPLDGLYTKLNFINEKLYIELDRDQYTQASVKKDSSFVELHVKNLEKTAHDTDIKVTGLKAGSYRIFVNDEVKGSFLAIDGQTAVVTAPLPAAVSAIVKLEGGEALANTAPVADAGEDKTTYVSDYFRLEGKASDDGYPNMTLTSVWEVVYAPEGSNPAIKTSDKLISEVSFDKEGTYKFDLTVSDSVYSGNDTVMVSVYKDLDIPEQLASYTFDKITEVDSINKFVVDETGEGYNAKLVGNPTISDAKDGKGISMDGEIGGYVKLPSDLTKRVDEATIAVDVKLNSVQDNGTRLFEFGDMNEHYFYVSFENGNEITLCATNLSTGNTGKVNSGVIVADGYWKNVAVTLKNNTAILYVNGVEKAKLENSGFSFAGLGEVQRNYIGRSYSESTPFLDGIIDNFQMKSQAMSAEDMLSSYGTGEARTIISAVDKTIVTPVGTAPSLPDNIKVLYSDGIYEQAAVTWDTVSENNYAQAGLFEVTGLVDGTDIPVSLKVIVVSGTIQNLAANATPTAIIDTPGDLGGVAGLNDGYDPTSSRDASHGVWHNWQGAQGDPAWVRYDWDSEVILTGIDAYYFTDGNFAPSSVTLEYLDENSSWVQVTNAQGLGTELNEYNTTTFDPVVTTALKMTMTPKTLGIGVIEWKAYGYSDAEVIDKKDLKTAINIAEGLNQSLFTSGWDALQAVLSEANAVNADDNATQADVDSAVDDLNSAILNLVPAENNIAYNASVSTSFVSAWETLSAVNDGEVSVKSDAEGISSHYGTWGNSSAYETVTYTWPGDMEITSTELFIWNDGGGILTPASYKYEYKTANGDWAEVQNYQGYEVALDKFNVTTFGVIKTREFRVTIVKQAEDENGIGLIEWKVNGTYVGQGGVVDKSTLQTLIADAEGLEKDDYTTGSWEVVADALSAAKTVEVKTDATQEEVDEAATALQTAIAGLVKRSTGSSSTKKHNHSSTSVYVQSQAPSVVSTLPSGDKEQTTKAVLTPWATMDQKTKAVAANVAKELLAEAVDMVTSEAAKQDKNSVKQVDIKINAPKDAKIIEASIAKESIGNIVEKGIDEFKVSSTVAEITFNRDAISTISTEAAGDIKIKAAKVEDETLSDTIKEKVGNRPVFNFSVTSGDKIVSKFNGKVTIAIPYVPDAGENTDAIVIYYITDAGQAEIVQNCKYDSETGMVTFKTTHFSKYAVGYNKIVFRDVAEGAWYSDAIEFIAARGITSGTGKDIFSPDDNVTRGQFIVMLMRAYGINPDENPVNNFADAGNTYYTNYIAAAKGLGISNGIGGNMFAPEKEITRQEMFTLLYNSLKIIDELPEDKGEKTLKDFSDKDMVASWAKDAMTLLVGSEVISGNNGQLSPKGMANRAQIAQILYNLLNQ